MADRWSSAFTPTPLDSRLSGLLSEFPECDERLHQSIDLLDRYSTDLAIAILEKLDVVELLREWGSAEDIMRLRCFKPSFRVALAWLLSRLRESALIDSDGEGRFRLTRPLPQPRLHELNELGLSIDPANAASLSLMEHAASVYPSIARGERSGEHALFGLGEIELWSNYFCNANPSYAINNAIASKAAADRAGAKILEIGAGTGSASEALLGALEARGIAVERYVVTEPSAFFRRRAERTLKRRFPGFHLEFAALDMDRAWHQQGVREAEFDLVYAVNVLHVAKNLLTTLRHARDTLAPNGCLVVGECLRPHPGQPIYPELIFQILDSYIDVTLEPEFRPNPGFLTAEQWRSAFARAGFKIIEIVPEIERIRELYSRFFTGAICARVQA